ncbi:hypothetical protein AB0H73_01795 [Streptomyces olivoreticuli]
MAHITAKAYGGLPVSYRTGLARTRALALYRTLPGDTPGLDQLADALGTASSLDHGVIPGLTDQARTRPPFENGRR